MVDSMADWMVAILFFASLVVLAGGPVDTAI
jgi:hypothetical protein